MHKQTGESQVNKSRIKSKSEFLLHIFNKCFCLHSILLFFKSCPEIESTWPTVKCRWRKSFGTWYYIVICAMLYVSFSLKLKATYVFPKHILKSTAHDQSIQARNCFFQMILYNYLYNSLCKFFIKIKSMWRHEIKEQTLKLTLLYYSRTVRSSYWRFSVKKLLLKILQYLQEMPVLESYFKKVADLKTCNFIKKRPQCRCFPVNIVKFLRLPILKNIFERLLFDSFNGSCV